MKSELILATIAIYEIARDTEKNVKGMDGYTVHVVSGLPIRHQHLIERYEAARKKALRQVVAEIEKRHPELKPRIG